VKARLMAVRGSDRDAVFNGAVEKTASVAIQLAFDHVAADYDRLFTDSVLGRLQREAVWRQIGGLFRSGDSVLDLGCGTGADTVCLARRGIRVEAIDISQGMIAATRARVEADGLQQLVTTRVLAIEALARMTDSGRDFDGVISNFGALNCVRDLRPFAAALRRLIRKGAVAALGVIGRFCLWETLYYGLRGDFAKAGRRWNGETRASLGFGEDFPVYYPTVGQLERAFHPGFRLRKVTGVGVFVPPTVAAPAAIRFPWLIEGFGAADKSVESWGGFRAVADHRLLLFEAM
jgi:ubiquinone/menaquinone biosynthesis C-methylase UbiE